LSKDTAISRPDNVADKTLFSTCALFSEVSCFLLLDESVLSEVTFGVSLLGTSCLFSGTVCPLGPSDSESFEVGVTGTTTGVYLAVIGVPFLSTRLTVTPVA